jgi:quercetin dioxygenase-like cupin family protein
MLFGEITNKFFNIIEVNTLDTNIVKRTVVRHPAADESDFQAGLRDYSKYRDIGIRDVTNGAYTAHVTRAVPGKQPDATWHKHEVDFQMTFILRGWIVLEFEDIGFVRMQPGSSCYQPPGIHHRVIANSDDFEMVEIISPAVFRTELVSAS